MVDQDAYVESVADVAIPAERLYQNGPLQKQEVGNTDTTTTMCQMQFAFDRGGYQWHLGNSSRDPTDDH